MESAVKSAIERIELATQRKLNLLEARVGTIVKSALEGAAEKQAEVRVSSQETAALAEKMGLELQAISRRLALLEGIKDSNLMLRDISRRFEAFEAGAEVPQPNTAAQEVAALNQAVATLDATLASPDNQDRISEVIRDAVVGAVDRGLESSALGFLSKRINELPEAIAETWRMLIANNTEDKLRIVRIVEEKLDHLVTAVGEHAAFSVPMEQQIQRDLVSGFSKLTDQITAQLQSTQQQLESMMLRQEQALVKMAQSLQVISTNLARIVAWETDAQNRNQRLSASGTSYDLWEGGPKR